MIQFNFNQPVGSIDLLNVMIQGAFEGLVIGKFLEPVTEYDGKADYIYFMTEEHQQSILDQQRKFIQKNPQCQLLDERHPITNIIVDIENDTDTENEEKMYRTKNDIFIEIDVDKDTNRFAYNAVSIQKGKIRTRAFKSTVNNNLDSFLALSDGNDKIKQLTYGVSLTDKLNSECNNFQVVKEERGYISSKTIMQSKAAGNVSKDLKEEQVPIENPKQEDVEAQESSVEEDQHESITLDLEEENEELTKESKESDNTPTQQQEAEIEESLEKSEDVSHEIVPEVNVTVSDDADIFATKSLEEKQAELASKYNIDEDDLPF